MLNGSRRATLAQRFPDSEHPMSSASDVLHIGIGSHVVALRASTGEELWRTQLKSSSFVTVYRDGRNLFAGAGGQLFCLDADTGEVRWQNKLKGLGTGLIAFASSGEAGATVSQMASAQATQAATIAATAAIIAAS